METTLSSKGQIVIPRQIRQRHGWRPGAIFTIVDDGDALVLKLTTSRYTTSLDEVIGCAGYSGPIKSLAEMDAGIMEEARKQAASWLR
jgi:AbrB family looped-hinge helix DNA binding protein